MKSDEKTQVGENVTISRRGKRGVWTADYHFVNANGQRQHGRKSLKTRLRRVAEQRARELEKMLEKGEMTTNAQTPVPLDIAIQEFVRSKEMDGKAKKTLTKYRAELQVLSAYVKDQGVSNVQQITARHCDGYKSARRNTKKIADKSGTPDAAARLDPYTSYNLMVVIKTFLKWCKSRGLIAANPLAEVRLVKPRRRRHPAATFEQLEAVLGLASGWLFEVLITLSFTGLRIGELIALRSEDVDLVGGWIRVRPKEGWRPKTEHSEREVPIHPRLMAVLKEVEKSKANYFFTAPRSPQFPLGDHHVNDRMVNERFKELAKSCGFPIGRDKQGLTVHALRRFFKTYSLDSGVPKPMVDYWMGQPDRNSMDFFYYDPQKSKEWMERVPFGKPNEDDRKRLKGGA